MLDSSIIQLANSLMLFFAVIGGMYFVTMWRKDKKYESQGLMLSRESEEDTSKNQEQNNFNNLGGYINIEIPEDHKSLFHDFLKGFEDYASIRGYQVSFSSDTTENGTFSFKFTIKDSGITVSTSKVKEDFNDYLRKVESGESLDDLPIVTNRGIYICQDATSFVEVNPRCTNKLELQIGERSRELIGLSFNTICFSKEQFRRTDKSNSLI